MASKLLTCWNGNQKSPNMLKSKYNCLFMKNRNGQEVVENINRSINMDVMQNPFNLIKKYLSQPTVKVVFKNF